MPQRSDFVVLIVAIHVLPIDFPFYAGASEVKMPWSGWSVTTDRLRIVVLHFVGVPLVAVRAGIGDSPFDVLKNAEGRPVDLSAERQVAGFARDDEEWPPQTGSGLRSR